jgi:hypothetical protein
MAARGGLAFTVFCVACCVPTIGAAQVTSENNDRLRAALKEHPDADADGDGILTLDEAKTFRKRLQTERSRRPDRKPARARRAFDAAKLATMEKSGDGLWIASTGHSLVAPALGPFEAIAKAAGFEGHLQIRQLSGGATGSPRAHWEKPDEQQVVKRALETGKCDVLTMGAHWEGSEVDDFARWIELGRKHNPQMVFYVQDAWPRLTDLVPGNWRDPENAKVTFDKYEATMAELNDWIAAKVEALNERFPGRVHVIPVGNGMLELVRRHLRGELPGVEAIVVPKEQAERRTSLYRDSIHPSRMVATLEGYIYFACIYRKNPAELPQHVFDVPELDRILREVAWKVVTEHPHSGVTQEK